MFVKLGPVEQPDRFPKSLSRIAPVVDEMIYVHIGINIVFYMTVLFSHPNNTTGNWLC